MPEATGDSALWAGAGVLLAAFIATIYKYIIEIKANKPKPSAQSSPIGDMRVFAAGFDRNYMFLISEHLDRLQGRSGDGNEHLEEIANELKRIRLILHRAHPSNDDS